MFPKIEFTTTGVPSNSLTIAFATADPRIKDGTIVLDASSLTAGKNVDVMVRDREVYVDGVLNNGLISSVNYWPMISPEYSTSITWTNTTGITSNKVDYYEALSA